MPCLPACPLAGWKTGWLWLAACLSLPCLLASLACLPACPACWLAGFLACWLAGLLACWLAGLLACWLAAKNTRTHTHTNKKKAKPMPLNHHHQTHWVANTGLLELAAAAKAETYASQQHVARANDWHGLAHKPFLKGSAVGSAPPSPNLRPCVKCFIPHAKAEHVSARNIRHL